MALSYDRTLLKVDYHIAQSQSDKRRVCKGLVYYQMSVRDRMLVSG